MGRVCLCFWHHDGDAIRTFFSWWTACRLWGAMDEADDADLLCVASATSFVEYLGSLEEHSEVLQGLLMEKNAEGFTPFMAAVACKVHVMPVLVMA